MATFFIIGLVVACALLWQRVERLERRVHAMEHGAWAGDEAPVLTAFPTDASSPWRRGEAVIPDPEPAPATPVAATAPRPSATPLVPEPVRVEAAPLPPTPPPPPPPPPIDIPARMGFEELFGRTLPIWAGGATLAVAGFLIVKYSIEAGLLSPAVRVFFGFLFGFGLVAGAETARRQAARVRDPRVAQALSGAGIATLYGAILAAHHLYALVGPATAFVGMASVTLAAGLLSLRFGAPSAVLGLLGGLAAPALVGSNEPNTPLLAGYLGLAIGGLCALSRRQGWTWLGVLSLVGGSGWVLLLVLAKLFDAPALVDADTLSLGLLVLLLTIMLPTVVLAPRRPGPLRGIAGIAGCLQVALLVATGGFGALEWGLFGLVSTALIWTASRLSALRDLPAAGLATALLLTLIWSGPDAQGLGLVLAGIAAIYGGTALLRTWRAGSRVLDAVQIAAIAAAIPLVPIFHYAEPVRSTAWLPYAGLALLGAGLAAAAAALGWRDATRRDDARFATLVGAAAALIALAALLALRVWLLAPAIGGIALALLALSRAADDNRVETLAWTAAATAIVLTATTHPAELIRAAGEAADVIASQTSLRWGIAAIVALGFAWRARLGDGAYRAATLIAPLAYVAVAQWIAPPWLPLVPSLVLAALALAPTDDRRRLAAMTGAAVVGLLWAVEPFATWSLHGLAALAGEPMLGARLPDRIVTLTQLAEPSAALALVARRASTRTASIIAGVLTIATAHILWKQVFALRDTADFVARGLAERTIWELVLTVVALAAWRMRRPRIALIVGSLAAAHLGWFTLLLHNPLWTMQAAGPWLVIAYTLAFALLWASTRMAVPSPTWWPRVRDGVRIILMPLATASLLRQIFHGDILVGGGVSAAEDIARSLAGIALAVGYLRYGIARTLRDWRIASLVIMLATVLKVFAVDAAGLDGLLRIASFAALGFSLIGVGWLYSRYLPDRDRNA